MIPKAVKTSHPRSLVMTGLGAERDAGDEPKCTSGYGPKPSAPQRGRAFSITYDPSWLLS